MTAIGRQQTLERQCQNGLSLVGVAKCACVFLQRIQLALQTFAQRLPRRPIGTLGQKTVGLIELCREAKVGPSLGKIEVAQHSLQRHGAIKGGQEIIHPKFSASKQRIPPAHSTTSSGSARQSLAVVRSQAEPGNELYFAWERVMGALLCFDEVLAIEAADGVADVPRRLVETLGLAQVAAQFELQGVDGVAGVAAIGLHDV